jgi:hypothetical protein
MILERCLGLPQKMLNRDAPLFSNVQQIDFGLRCLEFIDILPTGTRIREIGARDQILDFGQRSSVPICKFDITRAYDIIQLFVVSEPTPWGSINPKTVE